MRQGFGRIFTGFGRIPNPTESTGFGRIRIRIQRFGRTLKNLYTRQQTYKPGAHMNSALSNSLDIAVLYPMLQILGILVPLPTRTQIFPYPTHHQCKNVTLGCILPHFHSKSFSVVFFCDFFSSMQNNVVEAEKNTKTLMNFHLLAHMMGY